MKKKRYDIKRIADNAEILIIPETVDCFAYGDLDEESTNSFNNIVDEIDEFNRLLPDGVFACDLNSLLLGNSKTRVYGKATCNALQGHLMLDGDTLTGLSLRA